MRGLVKRVGLLDNYSKWIIRISFLVIFISIFELLGYFGGVLEADPDLGLIGTINNFSFVINAIQYLISAVVGISPLVCAVLLFMSYSTVVYDTKYITCVVPQSNRDKILRVFKAYGFWFLSYFIMTSILYLVMFNGQGIEVQDVFAIILQRFVCVTFLSIGIIIMDMECKDSSLKKGATAFWNIMAMVFSNLILFIVLAALSPFKLSEIIIYTVVLLIAVLGGIYILRRVDKVKLN